MPKKPLKKIPLEPQPDAWKSLPPEWEEFEHVARAPMQKGVDKVYAEYKDGDMVHTKSTDGNGHYEQLPQVKVPQGTKATIAELMTFFPHFRSTQDVVRTGVEIVMKVWQAKLEEMYEEGGEVMYYRAGTQAGRMITLMQLEQNEIFAQGIETHMAQVEDRMQRKIDRGWWIEVHRDCQAIKEEIEVMKLDPDMDPTVIKQLTQLVERALARPEVQQAMREWTISKAERQAEGSMPKKPRTVKQQIIIDEAPKEEDWG